MDPEGALVVPLPFAALDGVEDLSSIRRDPHFSHGPQTMKLLARESKSLSAELCGNSDDRGNHGRHEPEKKSDAAYRVHVYSLEDEFHRDLRLESPFETRPPEP
jgi:hypothetical protein